MSINNLLHISKLDDFKEYLKSHGYITLDTIGKWEVLRWAGEPGKPMPIIFKRHSAKEHLSVNKAAEPYVRAYLRSRNEESA